MPTDERRLPLMPILPWQSPPTTRDHLGRFMPGVCGNQNGRPTNARLAAKRAAIGKHEHLSRLANRRLLLSNRLVVSGFRLPRSGEKLDKEAPGYFKNPISTG